MSEKIPLRILILCPLKYVASIAFVMESIVGFANRGHKIDVLVSNHSDPSFSCDHENVRMYTYRDHERLRGLQYLEFIKTAILCAKTRRYDLVIGLSQMGLIAAVLIKKRFGIPCVFYNDEIWFGNERHTLLGNMFGYGMKFLERRANQQVMFTVTQDPERGRFLADVNHISMESLRYLPNSRTGSAQISTSTYMHDRFGFPPDTKIILWMGSVSPGDGALGLARNTDWWPKDWRLVFHFRSENFDPYKKKVIECNDRGSTYVSMKPVPYSEVDELIASATIGLGIYADKGINARYIGSSSGKINLFLKSGIPCIVPDFEGLRWVEESGAGLSVEDSSCVFKAAIKIVKDYKKYQRDCIKTFESRLSFDNAFEPIAIKIERRLGKCL